MKGGPTTSTGGSAGRPRPAQQGDPSANCAEPSETAAEETDASRPRLVGKTIRLRDKHHRKFAAKQPCVLRGRTPADPHHLRGAQPRRLHHNELHRYGDEASWWAGVNVDPVPIALELWRRTRLDLDGARRPVREGAQPQAATSADSAGRNQTGV